MQNRQRLIVRIFLLLSAVFFLVPKFILIEYFSDRWVTLDAKNILLFLSQDLILAGLFLVVASIFMRKINIRTLLLTGLTAGLILVLLLFDMRVRELWLKPLDFSIIKYGLDNSSDLSSGLDIFFNYQAGFDLTFRFILFILVVSYAGLWLTTVFLLAFFRKPGNQKITHHPYRVPGRILTFLIAISLVIWAASLNNARYNLNKNILIDPLVSSVQTVYAMNDGETRQLAPFEQPLYPIREIQNAPLLQDIPSSAPYKNLVIIVLESVRWNSVYGGDQNLPTFDKLSREGMTFKSYVSIPHSSKGYYAIMMGAHAYPDIEIKEASVLHQPSFIHELKKRYNMEAVAFSSLFLQFENMGGFLKSIGISRAYPVSELLERNGITAASGSSFGSEDDHLYSASIPYLKDIQATGKGFVAVYFPSAAHYPYECGETDNKKSDLEKYESCIAKTDRLIGQMLETYKTEGLMDSTLFVLVGDHGESFGEHGMFIHNSSMYEEEVTVPLIFWARNGLPKNKFLLSQQIDIAPTIADFFGILDADLEVQGKSLLREQGKRAFFMTTFFSNLSSAVVEHPEKYIFDHNARTATRFNLENDPAERSPLSVSSEKTKEIRSRIEAFISYQKKVFSEKEEQNND